MFHFGSEYSPKLEGHHEILQAEGFQTSRWFIHTRKENLSNEKVSRADKETFLALNHELQLLKFRKSEQVYQPFWIS